MSQQFLKTQCVIFRFTLNLYSTVTTCMPEKSNLFLCVFCLISNQFIVGLVREERTEQFLPTFAIVSSDKKITQKIMTYEK